MIETTDEPTPVESTEDEAETVADLPPIDDADEDQGDDEPEMFPREVVEKLRQENGKYRQRAQRADTLAHRLHTELVRATGRLADPSDLEFSEDHLEDTNTLVAAVDELLRNKPHLASRRPTGDIGQGNRGSSVEPFSLLQMLKVRT